MRVSAAGNMPLQGLVKPPAKPVVMIVMDFVLNACSFKKFVDRVCQFLTKKLKKLETL